MGLHNSGNPSYFTEDDTGAWGADHGYPSAALAVGERMFLGWNYCEVGRGLIETDLQGRKKRGFIIPVSYLATDGKRAAITAGSLVGAGGQVKEAIARREITLTYAGEFDAIVELGNADGASLGGQILIRDDLSPALEFSVLVHELAHEMLHRDQKRKTLSKTVRETEAEAVAFVVSQAIGLDTNTAAPDYIQLYAGDKDTLAESLDRIQKTATTIIEEISLDRDEAEPRRRVA